MRRHDLETATEIVEAVRAALSVDARPAVRGVQARLTRLISQQRFEEAAIVRRRLETLTRTAARFHRIRSLAACAEIVAAPKSTLTGRYTSSATVGWPAQGSRHLGVPQAVARAVRATAETVPKPLTRCQQRASRKLSGSPTGSNGPVPD